MRTHTRLLSALTLLLLAHTAKAGGPWTTPKGHGYAQVQAIFPAYRYSGLLMSHFRDVQGVNRYTYNADYSAYLEYGITDRLDLTTALPFKYISTGDLTDEQYFDPLLEEGNLTGLSNYHLGLKYGLVDGDVKVAMSFLTRWNTATFDMDKGLATGYEANSYGLMLHVGRGNDRQYGFVEVGYHYMSNDYSDIIEVNLEHGWKVKEVWYLAAMFNVRKSLYNGSYQNNALSQTGMYPNNQEWIVGSLKIARELDKGWGLNTALPLVPIYFNQVGFNGAFSLGLYRKL